MDTIGENLCTKSRRWGLVRNNIDSTLLSIHNGVSHDPKNTVYSILLLLYSVHAALQVYSNMCCSLRNMCCSLNLNRVQELT